MSENNDMKPSEPRGNAWLDQLDFYIVGILAGLFASGAITFLLFFGMVNIDHGANARWATGICFALLAIAIAATVHLIKPGRVRERPFVLGLLTGVCVVALVMGICFAASFGPVRPS